MSGRVIAVALGACLAACTTTAPAPAPEEPPAMAADPQSAGGNVFLRARAEGDRVAVDVLANRTRDVHGVALRLTWDPGALDYDRTITGAAWSPRAIALAKEGTPGQLAIAWTETGVSSGFDATNDTVLGTIVFRSTGAAAKIAFRPERSRVVDRSGATVDVAWRGGTVLAR